MFGTKLIDHSVIKTSLPFRPDAWYDRVYGHWGNMIHEGAFFISYIKSVVCPDIDFGFELQKPRTTPPSQSVDPPPRPLEIHHHQPQRLNYVFNL
jgi:hypothetical protein